MQAIRAYMTQGERMYDNLVNLGDTMGLLEEKSARMAGTSKSSLQGLQTAFESFADKGLSGPLQDLTSLLNKLAENPEKIEDAIRNITITLGLLAGVKIGAGIISFVASLNSLKSGGGLNMSGLANAGGGAGIPVHVTNWGGSGGGLPGFSGPPTAGSGGLVDQYGRPLASGPGIAPPPALPATEGRARQALAAGKAAIKSPKTIATGVSAGLLAAVYEIPEMFDEIRDVDRDETLTATEKSKAKGGAIGDASGSIIGAAGGTIAGGVLAAMATSALAGTAIGTAIPGLGNILGLVIGAGIGAAGYYFGGKAGQGIGEKIGAASAVENKELDAAQINYRNALEEAADTIGKTAEEIENARKKLTEAEARLEKAKETKELEGPAREMVQEDALSRMVSVGYDPSAYIASRPEALTMEKALELLRGNSERASSRGLGGPHITGRARPVNDLIVTPQGQFSTHPDDFIFAAKDPAALLTAGITAVNNRYQNNTNIAGAQIVNDLIVTPRGQFSTHPDDYILAMRNPAALVNPETSFSRETRNEVRTVERIPQALPPVIVDGEIVLRSELIIDDKGYRLRQSAGKNTTPYKFAVGNAKNARLIQ